MVLSGDLAALIGFGCEAIAYGVYIILFLLSLAFLGWRRRTRELSKPMLFATCILFLFCTTHFAIEFNHFYNTLGTTGVENFAAETRLLVVADILLSLIDFIGDLVLLYRCWLVWGRNHYVIILPFLTALGGFTCAMTGLGIVNATLLNTQLAPSSIVPLGTAAFTLPLATNIIITALIVGRIYYVLHETYKDVAPETRGSENKISQAASVMIESGMLYLVTQLVFVVLYAIGHPAYEIVAVVAVQMYGIAPTLIFFRVGLGLSAETTTRGPGSIIRFKHMSQRHDDFKHSEGGISSRTGDTIAGIGPVTDVESGEDGENFQMTYKLVDARNESGSSTGDVDI